MRWRLSYGGRLARQGSRVDPHEAQICVLMILRNDKRGERRERVFAGIGVSLVHFVSCVRAYEEASV